jgi:hypothetical protein
MNAHNTASFGHHFFRGLITYWENALMGLNPFSPDIVLKPIRESLGDEDEFMLSAIFWDSECQSPLIDIFGNKFQNFTDPHPASCHQFKHQSIPWL